MPPRSKCCLRETLLKFVMIPSGELALERCHVDRRYNCKKKSKGSMKWKANPCEILRVIFKWWMVTGNGKGSWVKNSVHRLLKKNSSESCHAGRVKYLRLEVKLHYGMWIKYTDTLMVIELTFNTLFNTLTVIPSRTIEFC